MYILKVLIVVALIGLTVCKKAEGEKKPDWAKKDIRDYSDADMERLLDQWEVSDPLYVYLRLFRLLTSYIHNYRKMKNPLKPMNFQNIFDHNQKLICQNLT